MQRTLKKTSHPLATSQGRSLRSPAFKKMDQLGFVPMPYHLSILRITSSTFPKLYGSDWLKQLAPLSKAKVQVIIKAASDYYSKGYNPSNMLDIRGAKEYIQKVYPSLNGLSIAKVLMFLKGITKERFPADYNFLKTGSLDVSKQVSQSVRAAEKKVSSAAYEATDKLRRGAGAVVDTAKEVEKALPWYLKPKILAPAILAVVAMVYWQQIKAVASPFIPKKKKPVYKQNPIPRSEVKRAQKLYKKFHAFDSKRRYSIPKIKTDELVQLGKGLEIGYQSDKWTGKKENYLHKFGRGVKLYTTNDGKSLILHGGKMSVQDVGIVN